MLVVIQEVTDPQTKIVFQRMSDKSILLEVPGELRRFSKNDLIDCDLELNLSSFTKIQVIEAFERLALLLERKRSNILSSLDGVF